MLGCLILSAACRRVRCEERSICGGRFFCALLPERPRERQIRKAARLFKRKGVGRAVFPAACCDAAKWKQHGIEPVNCAAFRGRLLPRILAWALGKEKCERAGIFAQRADFGVQRAVEQLARESRYLYFDCGERTEELAAALRREWGVASVTEPTVKQLACCDVLVLFAPRSDIACRGRVISFYEGAEISWKYRIRNGGETYPDVDAEQLFAALWEMGKLRIKDVEIF